MGTIYKSTYLRQTQTLGFPDLSVNKREKSVRQKLNYSILGLLNLKKKGNLM